MNAREPYCLFLKLISFALNILRLNCYRRAVFDGGVDFFDFVVRDGDAAGGPVFPPVPEFKEECGTYRINEMMFLRLYRIRATVIVLEFSSTQ